MLNKRINSIEKQKFIHWDKNKLKNKFLLTDCFEDNKFLDKYIKLICKNWNTKKDGHEYRECHHILPLGYFNLKNIPAEENDDNYVYLKYEDHIFAHYYLSQAAKNKYLAYKLGLMTISIIGLAQKKPKQLGGLNFQKWLKDNTNKIQEIKNLALKTKFIAAKELWKEFNNYFIKQHLRYWEVDELKQRKRGWTRDTYANLCHEFGFESKYPFKQCLTEDEQLEKDLKLYNGLNAYYDKNKSTCDYVRDNHITNIQASSLTARYARMCKRRKWKNHNIYHQHIKSKIVDISLMTEQEKRDWNLFQQCFQLNMTMEDIDVQEKRTIPWAMRRHSAIRLRYGLPNNYPFKKTKEKQAVKDWEIINKCENHLKTGQTLIQLEILENKARGYYISMYSSACKRQHHKSMNPRTVVKVKLTLKEKQEKLKMFFI